MSSCKEETLFPEDQEQSADQVWTHPHPLCQQLNPVTKSRQSGPGETRQGNQRVGALSPIRPPFYRCQATALRYSGFARREPVEVVCSLCEEYRLVVTPKYGMRSQCHRG